MNTKNDLLLSEKMRPNLKNLQLLTGHAKKIWQNDLKKWRESQKFHAIFWGNPGSGKTTLAKMLAESVENPIFFLSAVKDGVKELRSCIDNSNITPIIFIDEIHRFSKVQQDALLPILEYSQAWIIGATTENPKVSLSAPILSRVRCINIKPLTIDDVCFSLQNILNIIKEESSFSIYISNKETKLQNELIPKIANISSGDLRFAINLLEQIIYAQNEEDEEDLFKNSLKFFSTQNHYDFISAMIKSMRGSDPDAALFYAINAIDSGEDPMYIARRCIIFASEDIGNADPQALNLAINTANAIEHVGMPEGIIPIAQCVTYLASTLKSNRSYIAIDTIRSWINQAKNSGKSFEPPVHLTIKGKSEYKYPHNFEESFVKTNYLPESIAEIKKNSKSNAYIPSSIGIEKRFLERLSYLWNKK